MSAGTHGGTGQTKAGVRRKGRFGGGAAAGRPGAPAAWSLLAASAALSLGGLLLLFLNGSPGRFFDESLGVDAVVGITYPAVGAVVLSRRPGNTVGWLFCAVGLAHAAAVFASEWALYALVTRPGALPLGVPLAWVASWVWIPGLVLNVTFLLLLFPDGRLPGRGWRPVAWLSAAVGVSGAAYVAVLPWRFLDPGLGVENPLAVEAALGFGGQALAAFLVLGFPALLLSAGALLARYRRARGVERQQIKWFLYAAVIYAVTLVVGVEPVENLQVLAAPLLPVAAGVAILRHGLYDIDRIINRTLVYAVLSAVLVAVYLGGVVSLQGLFRLLTGGESQLAVVASTLAIAALFNPLRRGVQDAVDRRFYRARYDAARTMERFSGRLRRETDLGALRGDLEGAVHEALAPEHVSLWLRPSGGGG